MNVTPQIRAHAAAQAVADLHTQAQARLARYVRDQAHAHQTLVAAQPEAPPAWSSNLARVPVQGAATGLDETTATTLGSSIWSLLSIAGTGIGAYHGYRRTGKIGWTLGWALLGGLFPIITIPVALAQGLGRPEPSFRKK